jgi:hypothetical protein
MRELNIVLAGLIWQEVADYEYLYKELSVPKLSKLLSKANITGHAGLSYSDFAYSNTKVQIGTTLANNYAAQLNLSGFNSYLLAEPTNLRADRDRLLIAESELLQLSETEAHEIIASINQHFEGEVKVFYLREDLWLLGTNLDLHDLNSYPIIDIIGENVDDYLPEGVSRIYLHKIMNEIQMLLFEHPVNSLRNEDNLLAVNSLWLWDKKIQPLPCKLGKAAHIKTSVKNIKQLISTADCNTLIIDDTYYPAKYRDSFGWVQRLHEIEEYLPEFIMDALRTGKFKTVNIWLPQLSNTWQLNINRFDLYKFWRNSDFTQISTQLNCNEN